jgi:CubicO group peptidase (beta-lactamase class C family)
MGRIALLLFLVLICHPRAVSSGPGPVPVPSSNYDLARYKRFSDSTEKKILAFFNKHYKSGIFNGTFLFFKNDSLVQGALGYANFGKPDSLINDDLFQLASVSKTVTGLAIVMLQQDGLLQIEDSVHWYIPELTRRNLTIRHLLSHTSGLPDYFYFPSYLWPNPAVHMKNSDVVFQINQQPERSFAQPGWAHSYSNTNYVLLAHIVEKLTGLDFRAYVRKYIFEPSNMKFSHICDYDSIPLLNYPVQGYENRRIYTDIPHNGTTGDKGVYSNTVEMFLLDRALRTDFILHRKEKELMWTSQVVTAADGQGYGLGWRVKYIDGRKWAFHNGWWKGFRTYYWRCLDEDKCFVVLSNNVKGPFLRTAEMVELLR